MVPEQTFTAGFTEFLENSEPRLRRALSASFGPERGREATVDALAFAWEHWSKVREMENPVGYLYVVGRNATRRAGRTRSHHFALRSDDPTPWVEPGLAKAVAGLAERERTVVMLLHGYGWAMSEVAETLGIAKSTVQTHAERGMRTLRRKLGARP